jgi:ATP/maltotriose-dependent transcriptional regulator MalT
MVSRLDELIDELAPLARNIAEVIDDLYRQHAPPRSQERLIALIQHQIKHAMREAVKTSWRR